MDLRDKLKFWIMLSNYVDMIVRGTSPLSLPDAIANSLSYVKAFGGTEQRNIPAEYTQVNYVTNTAQTMINTGVKFDFSKNYEIELKASGVTGSWYILQARESSGSPISGISGSSTGNVIGVNFDGTYVAASQISRVFGHIYYVKGTINNGNMTLYVKDETAGTEETVTGTYTPRTGQSVDICLFGNVAGNYVAIDSNVYFARIKENDTFVMDYVPARQGATAGFYDKVSGTFKTASNLVADGNAVPTPDTPMDIISNNGVLKYGQYGNNLATGVTITDGVTVDDTGAVISVTGASYSDYIEVKPNTKYTLTITRPTSTIHTRVCEYNSSQTFTSLLVKDTTHVTGVETNTFTTTANAKYVRLGLPQNTTNLTLKEVGIYTDGTVETINVHTKNLFDENWNRNTGVSTQTATWGQVVSAPSWSTSGLVPVKAGQQYTISYNIVVQLYVFYYESDGTMQQSYDTATSTKKTFTVPAGATHIRLQVNKSTEAQIADLESQLETGATATDYEPYYDGGTATAEMLLKVGDYQDVQSIIDGVVTRNVGVKVMTGDETFQVGTNGWISEDTITDNLNAIYTPICTHFAGTDTTPTANSNTVRVYYTSGGIPRVYFGVDKTIYTSDTVFKQWLKAQYNAGTPVIVVYPLATATTESVTGQTLQVTDGDNVLEITQASLNGLELESKYKKQA